MGGISLFTLAGLSILLQSLNSPKETDPADSGISSLYLVVAYNAVVTTLFVITLLISASCYVRWKKKADQAVHDPEMMPLQQLPANERTPGLPAVICPQCRLIQDSLTTPLPYRTMASVEKPQKLNRETGTGTGCGSGACAPRVRPEVAELETQTTPKSTDLSFDFNSTDSKRETT